MNGDQNLPTPDEDQDVDLPAAPVTLGDVYSAVLSLRDLVEQLLQPGRPVDPSVVELRA